jgi:hypothetical protein
MITGFQNFGQLVRLNVRSVMPSEVNDLSASLCSESGLELLSDALGMQLTLEEKEKAVGTFSADIVCRTQSDELVVIENQFDRTDHDHLGKLITYVAGLDAEIGVWIIEKMHDQHRAAIDWLNNNTSEKYKFFALTLEFWKIGDSLPAPKFNLVCSPNLWRKNKQAERNADNLKWNEVWSEIKNEYDKLQPELRFERIPKGKYMQIPLKGDQAYYEWGFWEDTREINFQVYLPELEKCQTIIRAIMALSDLPTGISAGHVKHKVRFPLKASSDGTVDPARAAQAMNAFIIQTKDVIEQLL